MSYRTELERAVSRHTWSRIFAFVIVAVMCLSAFAILQTPARAVPQAVIGLPPVAMPNYMKYINVNNFKFDPLAAMPTIPATLQYSSVARNTPSYYLVQFNGPVTPDMKKALAATDVTILYYVAYNTFIVRADGPAIDRAAALPSVRWTGVFEPAYKLSPRLSDEFGALAQRAMDRARYGDQASSDAVTVVGPGMSSKTLTLNSAASTVTAAGKSVSPVSSSLGGRSSAPSGAEAASATIPVEIMAFEPSRVPEIVRAVSFLGGHQTSYSFGQTGGVRAELSKSVIEKLARVPGVMYIDRFVQPYVMNDLARWVVQSGDTVNHATPVHDHGIFGTNQTITIGDTGIDYKHPDFWDPNNATPGPTARKLTAYYKDCGNTGHCDLNDNGINHGTHTSGSAAGDDGVWHVYDGDATGSNGTTGPHDGQSFDAFLNVQDLSDDGFGIYFDSVTPLWTDAVSHGSWIHSNSWGSCCSSYIPEDVDTDTFIWNNQDFLVLFAAGNSGSGLNSMNPFAVAKNVIGVGATVNGPGLESVADFSSRGPAGDGRLKPDVTAPGVSLWSAQGLDPGGDGTAYWTLSGTSMATPTVAGSAGLVRQYYMDGWYPTGSKSATDGFTPSAALIKATIINSAREMTGAGAYANGENKYPNDNQGFGRVTLDDALFFQGDARGLTVDDYRSGINTGDTVTYNLAIGDSTMPVEVTLVWTDYPGTANCAPCLVNDLDLTVTAPDGTTYNGNQYMGFNPGESQPNPTSRDNLNNVESVLVISNVQAGLWTVTVHGFNVPQGPQSFALVLTGGIATEHGVIGLDHHSYQSSATVDIKVVDTGLNLNPNGTDTVQVNMSSDTESTPELVTLTETGNSTAVFAGSIPLALGPPNPGDGVLQVSNGDNITAMYFDNNNGRGGSGPVYAYAVVDDSPPVISGTAASNLRFNRADIGWTTDELSDSLVSWGVGTPPGNTTGSATRTLSHSIALTGLNDNTTYFFAVQSTDEAGNTALDNNNSAYYSFTTAVKPPTAPPNAEWPTFHNNQPRQGISPSKHSPPMNQQWMDGPHLINRWNGPVMADGILFSAPLDGVLRARDPYSGELLWSRQLGGQFYYTSTMTAANGILYATFYGTSGGYVYALDEVTGNTIWVVGMSDTNLDFNARNVMTFADDLIFGTTWGRQAYALHASDGSVAWTFQLDGLAIASGATINAGVAYFETIAGTVFALDEFSGALIWSHTLDGVVTTTALYAQGNVYVGTYTGTEWALDALTGATVWSTGGFNLIDASAAAYDGINVYFGTFAATYVALDATDGHLVWQTSVAGPVGTAPAYANGFLYGTCWFCPLYSIDTADGSIADQDSLISSSGSTSFPAVSDGWVWLEDNDGNMFGFLGQLPVGLLLKPSSQAQDSVPDNVVTYDVNVKNVGVSGPDTFDATITTGAHGWAVALYESDGVTPLPDTDGDGIPDTGSLATGASADVVIKVTVPATVNAGDTELSRVTFTSSNDVSRFKVEKLTTTVPLPGVSIGPRAYFPLQPGDTAAAPMDVRNKGGLPDTIELAPTSGHGWTVTIYQADGVTLLTDTDGDGLVDTGQLPGLTTLSVVVSIQVPADAPLDMVDRTDVVASSAVDPNQTATSSVVIELAAPPSKEWPQFHHDRERGGVNPEPFQGPLTPQWTTSVGGGFPIQWTGSIIDGHMVIVTSPAGVISALDLGTGTILWQKSFGSGGDISGTPAASNGVLYVTFVTSSNTAVSLLAIDEATGALKWQVDSNIGFAFSTFSTVAVAAGNVYWDDGFGFHLFANDATTGAPVWTFNLPAASFQGPTYWGGMVFASDLNGDIYALDAFAGTQLWQTSVGNTVTSAPTVAGGVVYVGDYSGVVHAIDALTGQKIWDSPAVGALIDVSSPVVAGGYVFEGSFAFDFFSGFMTALDVNTGQVVWQYRMQAGAVGTSAAYNNGTVFLSTWDGNLWSWDAATGAVLQTLQLSSRGSTSSVALGDGYAVVGDQDGEMNGFSFVGAGVAARVVVNPASTDVAVGRAALFQAAAYDLYDNQVGGQTFVWSSQADLGSVLPLTPSGEKIVYIAGIQSGTDSLQAMNAGGLSNASTVNILPGPLDHVDVTPAAASIVAGTTMSFNADAKDRYGNTIHGLSFVWNATGGIGTIDASGVLNASTQVGLGLVTATTGSATGTAIVEIVPDVLATVALQPAAVSLEAGSNLALHAQGFDRYGNEISGLRFVWATTIGSVAPVETGSPTAVLAAGYLAGSGRITISSGGVTLVVGVDVTPGPLDRIQVVMLVGGSSFEGPVDIPAGAARTFVAETTDRFGNAIPNVPLTWTVTGGIGTVSSSGAFTASTRVGAGSVIAMYASGMTGRQEVTIVPATPARVDIGLTSTTLAVDSNSVIVATVRDAYGNANPDDLVTWTTTGTGTILSLTPDGRSILYHAPITTTPASVQITATIGAISRSVTVSIVAGPPVGISIDSPATTVALGGTLAFGAVVTDQFGNAVTGATIAWEVTAGSINQQGVFRAPSEPGLVVITASTAGRQSFVVIEVTSGALDQFSRQATSATSLALLVATILAIAAGVFLFVRYREARRELREMRKGEGGGET